MSKSTKADEATNPDDVPHRLTVADIERPRGREITEKQAEPIKDAPAQALTTVIQQLRDMDRTYDVRYQIRTGIDGSTVHKSKITVCGPTTKTARKAAITNVAQASARWDIRFEAQQQQQQCVSGNERAQAYVRSLTEGQTFQDPDNRDTAWRTVEKCWRMDGTTCVAVVESR